MDLSKVKRMRKELELTGLSLSVDRIIFSILIWRSLSVYTYAQCAAVRTHCELMREPPQK